MVVVNSAVYGNTAGGSNYVSAQGGGLFGLGPLVLAHSTVTRNIAGVANDDPRGGGLFVRLAYITNSIVAKNTGQQPDISLASGGRVSAEYSLIGNNEGSGLTETGKRQPDANGNWIGGQQIIDPLLSSGEPVPSSGSLAINAGDPSLAPGDGGLSEFDARRAPFSRIVDGRIDIGAYEFQKAGGVLSGDFNGDGRVDGADFLAWQRGVGGSGNQQAGDATGNGAVDGNDLAVWRSRFGPKGFAESAAVIVPPAESQKIAAVDAALLAKAESEREAAYQPISRPAYRPVVLASVHSTDNAAASRAKADARESEQQELDSIDKAFATRSGGF
jgi:hypothetical protein